MNAQKRVELAIVLVDIGRESERVESAAKGILSAIKQEGARGIEEFNAMVAAAFERNGWSSKAGRPTADAKPAAPRAVKYYVSLVRGAYRAGLDVAGFESIGAMRTATEEANRNHASAPAPKPPELRGISVSHENALTGALYHDLIVVWDHLEHDDKAELERRLRAVLKSFVKKAPPTLSVAA